MGTKAEIGRLKYHEFGPYDSWIANARLDVPLSSNQGTESLPFQRWFKFKEAFSPELVRTAFEKSNRWPDNCLDPFGGCGTMPLTAQFLGIKPSFIEVNPFLADLAEAKLSTYELASLQEDFSQIFEQACTAKVNAFKTLSEGPATLCERRGASAWVFPNEVIKRILQFRFAIDTVKSAKHRRLFRVLLGSILVGVSNVTVNGKGRKYRGKWQDRQKSARDVDICFENKCLFAFEDIARYSWRPQKKYHVRRGDAIKKTTNFSNIDLVFCSPPYPNSFDYTDIYNLELWVLGYLESRNHERSLRRSTLSSHVQVGRNFATCEIQTSTLRKILSRLEKSRSSLWNQNIPLMVESYFQDLLRLLRRMKSTVNPGGDVYFIVGDSSYAGVTISSGRIIAEIAEAIGYTVSSVETLRSLRKSAQQGGSSAMKEHSVHLVNA